jgi:hypothetical protein
MSAQLSSTANKGFLWSLMLESDVFGGVPPGKKDSVIDIFESVIKDIEYNNTGSLIEMNKAVIMKVNSLLDPIREKKQDISSYPPKLVTAAKISANRQEQFSNNLSERQRKFDDMIVTKKPVEVDFSDNSADEKPIGSEMDEMLSNIMARREQQMNQVLQTQDTNAAQTWINNDGSGSNAGPPILQFGEVVSTPKVEEVKPKQIVTFEDDSHEDVNILSLFKVKERKIDKEAVISKIQEIEARVKELSSLVEVLKNIVG